MKLRQHRVGNILAGIAALVLAGLALPLRAAPGGEVKVIRLRGHARYAADQKTWKELKVGKMLKAGTLIETAPGTILDLCLNEATHVKDTQASADNVLRIFEDTALNLDKLAGEEVQLDLRSGSVMGTVGIVPAGAKYEIRLPRGVLGVHSGTYIADASGTVNVIDGSATVAIVGADNAVTTKKIGGRQGYDPTTATVVALHMDRYPLPLNCSDSELPREAPSTPTSGVPHGSGMGGALRKF